MAARRRFSWRRPASVSLSVPVQRPVGASAGHLMATRPVPKSEAPHSVQDRGPRFLTHESCFRTDRTDPGAVSAHQAPELSTLGWPCLLARPAAASRLPATASICLVDLPFHDGPQGSGANSTPPRTRPSPDLDPFRYGGSVTGICARRTAPCSSRAKTMRLTTTPADRPAAPGSRGCARAGSRRCAAWRPGCRGSAAGNGASRGEG